MNEQEETAMIYDVWNFGAVADGKTLCTKAVQETVELCTAERKASAERSKRTNGK